jgi:hypothetical protein
VTPEPAERDGAVPRPAEPLSAPARDATEQSELDLGVVPTGSAAVDQALVPLEELADSPVAEHPDVYQRVLTDLAATMSEPADGASVAPGEPPVTD